MELVGDLLGGLGRSAEAGEARAVEAMDRRAAQLERSVEALAKQQAATMGKVDDVTVQLRSQVNVVVYRVMGLWGHSLGHTKREGTFVARAL